MPPSASGFRTNAWSAAPTPRAPRRRFAPIRTRGFARPEQDRMVGDRAIADRAHQIDMHAAERRRHHRNYDQHRAQHHQRNRHASARQMRVRNSIIAASACAEGAIAGWLIALTQLRSRALANRARGARRTRLTCKRPPDESAAQYFERLYDARPRMQCRLFWTSRHAMRAHRRNGRVLRPETRRRSRVRTHLHLQDHFLRVAIMYSMLSQRPGLRRARRDIRRARHRQQFVEVSPGPDRPPSADAPRSSARAAPTRRVGDPQSTRFFKCVRSSNACASRERPIAITKRCGCSPRFPRSNYRPPSTSDSPSPSAR